MICYPAASEQEHRTMPDRQKKVKVLNSWQWRWHRGTRTFGRGAEIYYCRLHATLHAADYKLRCTYAASTPKTFGHLQSLGAVPVPALSLFLWLEHWQLWQPLMCGHCVVKLAHLG